MPAKLESRHSATVTIPYKDSAGVRVLETLDVGFMITAISEADARDAVARLRCFAEAILRATYP